MQTKYSKQKFDGYTHRFKVEFETGAEYMSNIDIYANSNDKKELEEFINKNKSKEVISFNIILCSSIREDEFDNKLLDELFKI